MAELTSKEKGALFAILAEVLDDPQSFGDVLGNLDDALIKLGLSNDEISNVHDFVAEFKTDLEAVVCQTSWDYWPG